MEVDASKVIGDFLRLKQDIFTSDDFYKHLRSNGVKISKDQAKDLLRTSDFVFTLINNEYITRAGVFIGRWFSFKPSKEEIQKGQILLGHRCLPFINPETTPDAINVVTNEKLVTPESTVFSMNLAMDTFALYGEGYVIPYILNDKANDSTPLSSVQFNVPSEVKLTSWPLDKISPNRKVKYGDRILCRVVNWEMSFVEMTVLENDMNKMAVSKSALEREEWYTYFENGLLNSFDRNGPVGSIEEQLALLYLENQEELCIKNCGSAEEFLKHTKKIGFSSFGVESRIWRNGENVPYIGDWNRNYARDMVMADMSMTFSPYILDAFIEDNIHEENSGKRKPCSTEELAAKIFSSSLHMTTAERKLVLLNIEKRRDILKKNYNQFTEQPILAVRKQILELFSKVSDLLCSIGCSGLKMELFPQQEMIVLSQLYSHVVRLIEEVQNVFSRSQFPVDDVLLSLQGMEETFNDIGPVLVDALEFNRTKSFEILNSSDETDNKSGKRK